MGESGVQPGAPRRREKRAFTGLWWTLTWHVVRACPYQGQSTWFADQVLTAQPCDLIFVGLLSSEVTGRSWHYGFISEVPLTLGICDLEGDL